jgi:hypothetical protein
MNKEQLALAEGGKCKKLIAHLRDLFRHCPEDARKKEIRILKSWCQLSPRQATPAR